MPVQWFQHSGAPSHSLATRHCNPTLRLSPLVTWSLAASSPRHLALPNVRRRPQGLPAATESRHRPPLPEIVPGPSPPLAPHRPFRCCNLIPSVDSGLGELFQQADQTEPPKGRRITSGQSGARGIRFANPSRTRTPRADEGPVAGETRTRPGLGERPGLKRRAGRVTSGFDHFVKTRRKEFGIQFL